MAQPTHENIAEYAFVIYQDRVAGGDDKESTQEQQDNDWTTSEKFLTAKCDVEESQS